MKLGIYGGFNSRRIVIQQTGLLEFASPILTFKLVFIIYTQMRIGNRSMWCQRLEKYADLQQPTACSSAQSDNATQILDIAYNLNKYN
jgi:hypothetical protein